MKKPATLRDVGEDALVKRLIADAPLGAEVVAGAGDDCAVVEGVRRGELCLLKTDAIVEGVHFEAGCAPRLVGRKALARVLSDVAAMGGRPGQALVTLILPSETEIAWVEAVYAGLYQLARQHGVSVVGGETTRGKERILSVALTGGVSAKRWAARGGGRLGDVLLVTGKLGGSIGGRHLKFEPRLEQGQWLVEHFPIHAMMDISDGLAKDLPRLAGGAGLGFRVDLGRLPRHRGCSVEQAWGDGEDYELLMAVPKRCLKRLQTEWGERFPRVPLTAIGGLVEAEASTGGAAGGWDPFVRSSTSAIQGGGL
jgi:thiamine-monophosphate kinase